MHELLIALGVCPRLSRLVGLIVIVAAAMAVALLAMSVATSVLGVPALVVQLAAWGVWAVWLGFTFPRWRRELATRDVARPYRHAFVRQLLPGVAMNFALLVRPAIHGVLDDAVPLAAPDAASALGALLVVASSALIFASMHAIGPARAFFVYEYERVSGPVVAGVYRLVRHPLFVAGELGSLGLALCVGRVEALALAVVNLAFLPLYVAIEDRRSLGVMGEVYERYRARTGAVLPRVRRRH